MGIKVNITGKEASAAVLEVIPAGWYKVTISDGSLEESKSAKNAGKPYYRLEFTVAEPEEYEGRKVWTNAMLFEGALYTISGLMKSLGYNVEEGELEVPELDELIGKDVMAKVKITPKRSVEDQRTGEKKEYEERNDIQGFKPVGAVEASAPSKAAGAVSSGGQSFLP